MATGDSFKLGNFGTVAVSAQEGSFKAREV